MKTFERPAGHEKCKCSSTIYEALSFGYGRLDQNGFWEFGCSECAREHEKQFPDDGECWPHSKETLDKWKEKTSTTKCMNCGSVCLSESPVLECNNCNQVIKELIADAAKADSLGIVTEQDDNQH